MRQYLGKDVNFSSEGDLVEQWFGFFPSSTDELFPWVLTKAIPISFVLFVLSVVTTPLMDKAMGEEYDIDWSGKSGRLYQTLKSWGWVSDDDEETPLDRKARAEGKETPLEKRMRIQEEARAVMEARAAEATADSDVRRSKLRRMPGFVASEAAAAPEEPAAAGRSRAS